MFTLSRSLQGAGLRTGIGIVVVALLAGLTHAQPTTAPDKPPLTQQELDQMLAPLALYPDPLLTQVLMASTYPLEIIQADRWAKQHKDLKDAQLTAELEKQTWDASVKSLVNFPDVLSLMSDKLDLTIKLGDAFIEQQSDVMNTIQRLRAKAKGEGQLANNQQQNVVVEAAPTTPTQNVNVVVEQVTPPPTEVIRIEPTNPQVIYVPSYNPSVVYGAWPYPAYPPAPYYPPGYWASNAVSFGLGVACGAAWGYAWGNSNWGGGDVDIDVNRNTNINQNIDRSKYQQQIQNRQNGQAGQRGQAGQAGQRAQAGQTGRGTGTWQHDPSHRGAVPYRDNQTAQRFGNGATDQAARARDSYRGRADAGRQDIARGGANGYTGAAGGRAGAGGAGIQNQGGAGIQNRGGTGAQNRPSGVNGAQNRVSPGAGAGVSNRPVTPARQPSAAPRSGALNGANSSGAAARSASQRGQASRAASPSPRNAPARSAPSRSAGGGGGRAGGGRSGGGGGGRR